MNRIRAYFAISILYPDIEPLLSNRKINSPLAASMFTSKSDVDFIDYDLASSIFSSLNSGMYESIAQ